MNFQYKLIIAQGTYQVNDELLDAGVSMCFLFAFYDGLIEYGLAGPSLRVVSTMSVGYGEN